MLLWSGSRNAWIVALVALSVFLLLAGLRKLCVAAVILLPMILVVLAGSDVAGVSRVARGALPDVVVARMEDPAFGKRGRIFECALDLTREKPLLGWGIGNMAPECEQRGRCGPSNGPW